MFKDFKSVLFQIVTFECDDIVSTSSSISNGIESTENWGEISSGSGAESGNDELEDE